MEYSEVIEAIIAETRSAIGDVAIRRAKDLGTIDIDDDGTVTGETGPDDVRDLLEQYRGLMKKGADAHARRAVKELYENDTSVTDLELPDSIMPLEVRADRFASAL